ncbi:D-glucuronyl C5-epimerase B [Anthonomus grandis grandis]|uniref:D-glucuronyl C5-epimerase B n=1 Tax=Anthonomus grandis grandis TaxID=2921223 RepID=UPI002164F38C|nr:D-glucuronyl C5-epimerase B [Anthonomus grandis grandis]
MLNSVKQCKRLMNDVKSSSGSSQSQPFYALKDPPPVFFLIMRFNFKIALIFLVSISVFTILVLYLMCNKEAPELSAQGPNIKVFEVKSTEEIDCDINGQYVIGCKKEGSEVYLPFSFLHRYFEIYGKLNTNNGLPRFEWSHSYGKIYRPKTKHDPRGVFMYFENYNVELRDRVKCVSATDGVPVSTQWESQGYYYPTQIAQFGLSHYSKNLTEPEPRTVVLEDAEKELASWIVPETAHLQKVFNDKFDTQILEFRTSENYNEGIKLKLDHVLDLVLRVDMKLNENSSLTVILQNRENKDAYFLHYINSDIVLTAQDSNIYHGLGSVPEWRRLIRDLPVDLQKGLNYGSKEKLKHKIPKSKLKVINIILRGSGSIDNLTLSTSEHIQQFYDAADWFLKNQDLETGGWGIPVKRKLAPAFAVLEPGWYSAMGQGHALSVLARAYFHSGGDRRYLDAAMNGLKPFRVTSAEGGVLATFMNKYHWYEEYPTKPASFVLNGFIYSLLGLYDLMSIAPVDQSQEAEFLYNEGLTTLKSMLPLFDMGSGTVYDLRHVTLGIAPNLARWDYHATHVNQLLLLDTIEEEPLFKVTAERWIGYMVGKKADHN